MGYYFITPLVFVLILISFTFTHTTFMAQGRPPPIPSTAPQILKRTLIGSRPPRCERRCSSCARCEAIQVPIVPQHTTTPIKPAATRPHPLGSRGDNLSNYKPLSWKCKCGNLIFNP